MHTAKTASGKKPLLILLVLTMVFQFIPAMAFAQGTVNDEKQLQIAIISDLHIIPQEM